MRARGQVGRRFRQTEAVIPIEANGGGLPLDREYMKIVRESAAGQRVNGGQRGRTRVAGPVHAAMHLVGLLADVLHDVDLAAGGPADGIDVVTEHPERGPDSLPGRNLDASLEAPVGLREVGGGLQAGRGVAAGDTVGAGVVLLEHVDDEVSILLNGILGACRVVLELVVSPAIAAALERPFGRVRRGAVATGKLGAPGKGPTWRSGGR